VNAEGFYVHVGDEYINYTPFKDPFFRCTENGLPNWCDHLQTLVKDTLDAEHWPEFLVYAEKDLIPLRVPMLPSLALFSTVNLHPVEVGKQKIRNAAEILLEVPSKKKNVEWDLIGFFNPGDSLASIRDTIFDWFRGNILLRRQATGAKLGACTSSAHKVSAQRNWSQAMKAGDNRALAEYFCVWMTGKCTHCQRGWEDGWEPDLIPDAGKPKTPWNN
jgi:hypothetical protein